MAFPPDSFFVKTDIAHDIPLLEDFVRKKLLYLHKLDVPVFASDDVIHYSADEEPATVPDEVVAILIRQHETPPAICTHKKHSGFFVEQELSGRPEQFFVLLVNYGYDRGCTINATVEARFFHPADDIAKQTFLRYSREASRAMAQP